MSRNRTSSVNQDIALQLTDTTLSANCEQLQECIDIQFHEAEHAHSYQDQIEESPSQVFS